MRLALFVAVLLHASLGKDLPSKKPSFPAAGGTPPITSLYSQPIGRCYSSRGELKDCTCSNGTVPFFTEKKVFGQRRVYGRICTTECSKSSDCPAFKHGFGLRPYCGSQGKCLLSCDRLYAWCPSSTRCLHTPDIGRSMRGVELYSGGQIKRHLPKWYEGWDDDNRFFCKMDIKKSTEMEIVADVDIRYGWTGGKCVNCYFEYGVWTEAGSRDKTHVAALVGFDEVAQPYDSPTDDCLAKLGKVAGVGYHCSWNAYPKNGRMIFKLCKAHFELTKVS
ncbi:hypothetical protein FOL46_000527 [Perkinsus olseni]|uniref:Uncharacterized protein n=3 Tax=Perkinsus olseni TaxID=32597 RepID=A0A7J6KUY2_PEROL|nr:hypothetical protein FOL46_000527 [Perkinsus olseni]